MSYSGIVSIVLPWNFRFYVIIHICIFYFILILVTGKIQKVSYRHQETFEKMEKLREES